MNNGYNPNKDSGIADIRSFVEIPSSAIPDGFISEYDEVPPEYRRYFAQLVYMVPVNATNSSSQITNYFTEEELIILKDLIKTDEDVQALKELIKNKDEIISLLNNNK